MGAEAGGARRRGAIQATIGGAVAALLYAWLQWKIAAGVVASIAGLLLLASLVSPTRLYAAIERGTAAFAGWVGTGLTWIVMPPIFFLIFLPFGLLFRRGRKDSMKRFFEADARSYWVVRDPAREATRSRERPF
jgi:hypothetical protein